VPVIVVSYWFAYRYRARETHHEHRHYSQFVCVRDHRNGRFCSGWLRVGGWQQPERPHPCAIRPNRRLKCAQQRRGRQAASPLRRGADLGSAAASRTIRALRGRLRKPDQEGARHDSSGPHAQLDKSRAA